MAAAASKPPATAHHTSVPPSSGAPRAYRVANTDPRSHNRVNACPVSVEAAQLGIELNMSLERIGTLASVATLVVVLYVQVKPAVNRWATVRYLLLCSEIDEFVLLLRTMRIRRVRMGVQLLLYQGLMTRADRRNGQNLFSQFAASAPTGCQPVVAIAYGVTQHRLNMFVVHVVCVAEIPGCPPCLHEIKQRFDVEPGARERGCPPRGEFHRATACQVDRAHRWAVGHVFVDSPYRTQVYPKRVGEGFEGAACGKPVGQSLRWDTTPDKGCLAAFPPGNIFEGGTVPPVNHPENHRVVSTLRPRTNREHRQCFFGCSTHVAPT